MVVLWWVHSWWEAGGGEEKVELAPYPDMLHVPLVENSKDWSGVVVSREKGCAQDCVLAGWSICCFAYL